jgi:hypothetical protein
VADHGRAKGAESFFADLDRSGNMQFNVSHKDCERFHKGKEEARSFGTRA